MKKKVGHAVKDAAGGTALLPIIETNRIKTNNERLSGSFLASQMHCLAGNCCAPALTTVMPAMMTQ